MKKIFVTGMIVLFAVPLFAQGNRQQPDTLQRDTTVVRSDSVTVKAGDKVVIIYDDGSTKVISEKEDKQNSSAGVTTGEHKVLGEVYTDYNKTEVRVGDKPFLQVIDNDDTVIVRVGKKGIKVIESPDGSTVRVVRDDAWQKEREKRKKRFHGSWRGIEFGMNSYLDPDFHFPGGYLAIYDGKAWNLNLNPFQFSFNFTRNGKLGMVTGIGLRFNNYVFANNNNIMKDSTGVIVEKPYEQDLKKSKLTATYLTVPAIFEFHTGHYKKGFRIGLGVVGSLKCKSSTKVKWYEEGDKRKEKTKGDFNVSPLDYALTARLGVGCVEVYANYSMVPLFKKGQGPEVYPLAVGLGIKF